jgi:hypothetical protein
MNKTDMKSELVVMSNLAIFVVVVVVGGGGECFNQGATIHR